MSANRRKNVETPIVVAAAGAGSAAIAGSGTIASHDRVVYFVTTSAVTGNVTLGIDISPNDGLTWHALTAGELLGNTSAITTNGNFHISAQVPMGTSCRLSYTVVTGPVTMLIYPCFEKSGGVF